MRKQKKSVVFFLFDILRTCFLKKLHTELQCCKVLARTERVPVSSNFVLNPENIKAAPGSTFSTHWGPWRHFISRRRYHACAQGGREKKKPKRHGAVQQQCMCVCPHHEEREWTGSSTSAFSIQHLLRTRVGTRSTTPSPYSPPLLPPLQNVRGQWLWESFKKIQTRLSRGAEW